MNACIRAAVRTALHAGKAVTGIYHGYQGIIDSDFVEMTSRSVSNIIQLGGTILKTARCADVRTEAGRQRAYDNLQTAGVDALIAIGGDGTFTGAGVFSREPDIPVVCGPGQIAHALLCTNLTH